MTEKNQYDTLKNASLRFFKPVGSNIQQTEPSEPVKALQIEEVQQVVESALIHPFKTLEAIVHLLERQDTLIQSLIQDNLIKRQVHDDNAVIGATLNYRLTYHRHLYVYLYCNTAFTLQVSNGATQSIPANYWSLVNYPEGSYLTVNGGSDTNPLQCSFRSCDVPLVPAQQQVLNAPGNNNISVPSVAGNTVIKVSGGQLVAITITTAGTGAGNVLIYDNPSTNSGTVLYAFPATITVPNNYLIEMPAKTGMTAVNVANGPVFTVGFQ